VTGNLQRRAHLHGPPPAPPDRAAVRSGPAARLPFDPIAMMMPANAVPRVPPDHTAPRETR